MATALLHPAQDSEIIYIAGELREWEFSNLLEILRLYAEKYCHIVQGLHGAGLQITLVDAGPAERKMAEDILIVLIPALVEMQRDSEAIGLEATSDAIKGALKSWSDFQDLRLFMYYCLSIQQSLTSELARRVCFILPRSSQKLYENPCEKWEQILETFPDARGDVEEMNRCMAFNRYPAAVFHALLAVEYGIVALGKFVGVTDLKPGWDATCNAVDKVLHIGRKDASPEILKHFTFLELVNKDMQSMKMAWRNKVSHAANQLFLMTSDFKPEVAEKIISACHGFMLLMATEGPNK